MFFLKTFGKKISKYITSSGVSFPKQLHMKLFRKEFFRIYERCLGKELFRTSYCLHFLLECSLLFFFLCKDSDDRIDDDDNNKTDMVQ